MNKKCPLCERFMHDNDFSVHYPKCKNRKLKAEREETVRKKISDFEESLNLICPLCKKHVKKRNFKTHWLIHYKDGKTSLEIYPYRNLKIICPFCGDTPKNTLCEHVRKYHYMEIGRWAKGIYDTETTKSQREENKPKRKIRIVSGGGYGQGKSRKH